MKAKDIESKAKMMLRQSVEEMKDMLARGEFAEWADNQYGMDEIEIKYLEENIQDNIDKLFVVLRGE